MADKISVKDAGALAQLFVKGIAGSDEAAFATNASIDTLVSNALSQGKTDFDLTGLAEDEVEQAKAYAHKVFGS